MHDSFSQSKNKKFSVCEIEKLMSYSINEWEKQNSIHSSKNIKFKALTVVTAFKYSIYALLGFCAIPTNLPSHFYAFQGRRHKTFHRLLPHNLVVIIGSRKERSYAKRNGYRFIWDFPIKGAGWLAAYSKIRFPLLLQIYIWKYILKKSASKFFLYEDTHIVGTFLALITKIATSESKAICIQHGFFCHSKEKYRIDGQLSDVNFIISNKQRHLFPQDRLVVEIGLPYLAQAKGESISAIILVGTGMSRLNPMHYQKSLMFFENLVNLLPRDVQNIVFYRPHPMELLHNSAIEQFTRKFSRINQINVQMLLNSSRKIFIGSVSTLLFEANVSGHLTARVDFEPNLISDLDTDLICSQDDLSTLAGWVLDQIQNPTPKPAMSDDDVNKLSSEDRFLKALSEIS